MSALTCEQHDLLYPPNPPECSPAFGRPAPTPTTSMVVQVTEHPETGMTPDLAQNLLVVATVLILIGIVALCARVRKGR